MAVNRKLLTADAKRAIDRFSENIVTAGETYRPIVAANDTNILIYQRYCRDSGIDVIVIPRRGLKEFIAQLVEADRDASTGRSDTFAVLAIDDN